MQTPLLQPIVLAKSSAQPQPAVVQTHSSAPEHSGNSKATIVGGRVGSCCLVCHPKPENLRHPQPSNCRPSPVATQTSQVTEPHNESQPGDGSTIPVTAHSQKAAKAAPVFQWTKCWWPASVGQCCSDDQFGAKLSGLLDHS